MMSSTLRSVFWYGEHLCFYLFNDCTGKQRERQAKDCTFFCTIKVVTL